jgi:hypothetical protein
MLIAQAMGEYAGMSGLASTIESLLNRGEELIAGLGGREYTAIALVAVALFFFFGRRS